MVKDRRVVTANLPEDLVLQIEKAADRLERSKSWIVREALVEWLADEQRRHELTLEALKDVDEGRTISQRELEEWVLKKKQDARKKAAT